MNGCRGCRSGEMIPVLDLGRVPAQDFFPLATDARLVATAGEMRHAGLSGPAPLMRGPVPSVNTSPSGGGGGRRILYRSRDARGRSASWAR